MLVKFNLHSLKQNKSIKLTEKIGYNIITYQLTHINKYINIYFWWYICEKILKIAAIEFSSNGSSYIFNSSYFQNKKVFMNNILIIVIITFISNQHFSIF